MFEFLQTMTLQSSFECRQAGILPPYLGSTIRGILGHCIRDFFCRNHNQKCFLCQERGDCFYVRYFGSTGGEAGAVNPYTLYVHGQGKERWEEGDICVFDLTLFGAAAEQAGIYLDALQAAELRGWGARRLAFRLVQIADPDTGLLIYGGGKCWSRNLCPRPMQIEARPASCAVLQFDTPLRIVSGGQLFQTLPCQVLIRFLIRRIALMTTKYTEYRLEWDEEEILAQAGNISTGGASFKEVPFARYSINQRDGRLELPARTGWVRYEGDLTRLTPILEAGKYLRAGKGATIGFGHYAITYDR